MEADSLEVADRERIVLLVSGNQRLTLTGETKLQSSGVLSSTVKGNG